MYWQWLVYFFFCVFGLVDLTLRLTRKPVIFSRLYGVFSINVDGVLKVLLLLFRTTGLVIFFLEQPLPLIQCWAIFMFEIQ